MQIPSIYRLVSFSLLAVSLLACNSGGSSGAATPGVTVPLGLKFSPPSGVVNTLVTIDGANFGKTPQENEVRFGGALGTVLLASETTLLAYVPGDAKSGPITVKSPGVLQTTGGDFLVAPSIAKLNPDRGTIGQEILIEGTGFEPELEGNQVVFTGGVATVVTATSTASITVIVPPGAQTGPITLTTKGGISASAAPFFVLLQPKIATFTPAAAKIGQVVTVQGSDFGPDIADNAVQFGFIQATVTGASTTQLSCTVPEGALTNAISVTTLGGTVTSAASFLVIPEISALSTAVTVPGQSLIITGKAFDSDPSKNVVSFGGVLGTVSAASYASLTATVPVGGVTGPVSVTTPGGSALSTDSLVVLSGPPSISAFSPASGSPGTSVTITGQNFSPVLSGNTVSFLGVNATVNSASGTQLVVTVPKDSGTGPIVVTTLAGSDASDADFTVTPLQNLRYAYAANTEDGTISAYTIESNFGFLRHHGYALSGTGASAGTKALAVHPTASLMAAANPGDGTVTLFSVGEDGRLSKSDEETLGGNPSALVWGAKGSRAYVLNEATNKIASFSVDLTAKTLTLVGSSLDTGSKPKSLAVTPNGKFAYVANFDSNNVSAFSIDPTGQLSSIGSFAAGTGPSSLAILPTGNVLYVANTTAGTLSLFTIQANGALQAAGSINLGAGSEPVHVAVDPLNRFVLTANKGNDTVSAFVVVSPTFLAGPVPLPAMDGPSSIGIDPTGKFFYVTHSLSNQVMLLGLTSGGALYSWTISARGAPSAFAVYTLGDPLQEESKFVVAASQSADTANLYSVAPGTGQLTLANTKSPGNDPSFVTADPFGRFAFVANSGQADAGSLLGNSVSVLRVDAASSTMNVTQTLKMAPLKDTFSVTVDPSGRFLAVPHTADDKISIFAIDPDTGALSGQQTFATGDFPRHAAFDASGRFLYVVNQLADTVSMYRMNAWSGALTSLGTVGATTTSATLAQAAADPRGRYLFVSDQGTLSFERGIVSYAVDPQAGLLSGGQKTPFDLAEFSGLPDSIAVDPYGALLYWGGTNLFGVGNLGSYSIHPTSGVLTKVVTSPFFSSAIASYRSIVLERKGSLLFAANAASTNQLQTHSLNLGVPAPISTIPEGLANPSSVAAIHFVK